MGGFCSGGFVQGDFVRGDFVLGGILSRGILSGGFCPGGFCPGGFCPRTSHQWLKYGLLGRKSSHKREMLHKQAKTYPKKCRNISMRNPISARQ